MVTGDSRTTAETVGRTLGVDAVEAEILPQQKDEVMKRLQAVGHVVAMAGDGVSNASAINGADISIVMERLGTEVTEQVAAIIVTDDNFTSYSRRRSTRLDPLILWSQACSSIT